MEHTKKSPKPEARGERHSAAWGKRLSGHFAGLAQTGELLLQRENRTEAISTGEVLLGPP